MKLIIPFTIILSTLIVTTSAATAVLDTEGKTVRTGIQYYIRPAARDVAGGLILTSRNGSCPLVVGQAQSGADLGYPLTFSPVNPKAKTVNLATDINIQFEVGTLCLQPTVWKLTGPQEGTGRYYVTSGGVKGNPGIETLDNWFKIEEFMGTYYKLSFCPTVCDTCKPLCGDLGIVIENGQRWLVFSTDRPFPFEFVKA
ncbi:hypothetical protein J5N97_002815 [Dioscorea zingiberensis]|uniref:Uncharacterized protein n=1 Tax=Dioscorea zingiberensis TaxID=325984 RepID=A0A9D5D4L7_9LILI|nr:hypothetical protein J5N97_002815 [Dioscorea zingiberensis]